MTQLAVDISNYQGDLPQQVFEAWRDVGVKTVICGTDGSDAAPLVFPQQATKAAAAGLTVEAYVYLYFGADGQPYDVVGRTNQKLDMIAQVPEVKFVWVDCEDTTSGLVPQVLVGLIANAIDTVIARGFAVGMYTGAWWWVPNTANSTLFASLPLWAADYDGQQDLELTNPFGGWAELHRKQYTDQGSLGGVSPLDLNVEAAPAAVDDFQRGRTEMYLGIARDLPGIPVGGVEAWLDSLPQAWGIEL
jgi:GH25 family lysozyme M1 (1,4-beta-N-acetylmuramidase)